MDPSLLFRQPPETSERLIFRVMEVPRTKYHRACVGWAALGKRNRPTPPFLAPWALEFLQEVSRHAERQFLASLTKGSGHRGWERPLPGSLENRCQSEQPVQTSIDQGSGAVCAHLLLQEAPSVQVGNGGLSPDPPFQSRFLCLIISTGQPWLRAPAFQRVQEAVERKVGKTHIGGGSLLVGSRPVKH